MIEEEKLSCFLQSFSLCSYPVGYISLRRLSSAQTQRLGISL